MSFCGLKLNYSREGKRAAGFMSYWTRLKRLKTVSHRSITLSWQ